MANRRQFFVGFIILTIGTMFYFVGRPEGSSYLQRKLVQADRVFAHVPNLFGGIGGSFPEFVHTFAFSLMGVGLVSRTRRSRLCICLIFLFMNALFEIGQGCGSLIGEYIPQWFNGVLLIENIDNYFSEGTFAGADLIAALVGSTLAFSVAEFSLEKMKGQTNGSQKQLFGCSHKSRREVKENE